MKQNISDKHKKEFSHPFKSRWQKALGSLTLAVVLLFGTAVPTLAGNDNDNRKASWIGTWGASPQSQVEAFFGPPPAPLMFNNQTIRTIARISRGGEHFRVRFDNSQADALLHIGAAHVALHVGGGTTVTGSDRMLSFGGLPGITIPAGGVALSDAVELEADDLAELAISLYLPDLTAFTSGHSLGQQTAYISPPGDYSADEMFPAQSTLIQRPFLSAVEVLARKKSLAIVTLGDSITDGFASTIDTNNRWPDRLAERIVADSRMRGRSVVNHGISGNRVLNNVIGPAALTRFDRDVLATSGVGFVTILEGINDIGLSEFFPAQEVRAEQIIQGYRQLISRAHAQCVKVIGATLTPFEGAIYYTPAGEAKRQAVNAFMRNSGEFDGVIDFDRIIRDPAYPTRFLPIYNSGDNLHPSDAGYDAMGEAVDLKLFRKQLKGCKLDN